MSIIRFRSVLINFKKKKRKIYRTIAFGLRLNSVEIGLFHRLNA